MCVCVCVCVCVVCVCVVCVRACVRACVGQLLRTSPAGTKRPSWKGPQKCVVFLVPRDYEQSCFLLAGERQGGGKNSSISHSLSSLCFPSQSSLCPRPLTFLPPTLSQHSLLVSLPLLCPRCLIWLPFSLSRSRLSAAVFWKLLWLLPHRQYLRSEKQCLLTGATFQMSCT